MDVDPPAADAAAGAGGATAPQQDTVAPPVLVKLEQQQLESTQHAASTTRTHTESSNGTTDQPPPGAPSASIDSGSGDGAGPPLFSATLIRQHRDEIQAASLHDLWAMATDFMLSPQQPQQRTPVASTPQQAERRSSASRRRGISERAKLCQLEAELAAKLDQLQLLEQQHNWLRMRETVLEDLMQLNLQTQTPQQQQTAPQQQQQQQLPESSNPAAALPCTPAPSEASGDLQPSGRLPSGPLSVPPPPASSVDRAGSATSATAVPAVASSSFSSPSSQGQLQGRMAPPAAVKQDTWAAITQATAATGGVEGALAVCVGAAAAPTGRDAGCGGSGSSSGDATAKVVQEVLAEIQRSP